MATEIARIHCSLMDYEVGKEDVTKIELTNQGSSKTTIYKLYFEDGTFLFVGMLEHEVEYAEIEEQTTIFDYL